MQLELPLIDELFCKYDDENPHIYEAFKKFTKQTIDKGFKHYSSKSIMEIIRWHSSEQGNDQFKVNNNFTPFYARKFEEEFPQYKGFFIKRESKFDK